MKRLFFVLAFVSAAFASMAQEACYWVFFTDKQGTTFDPYAYFDAKAVARYQQCGADLYDISNYPLNNGYVGQVDAIANDEVGQTRWFNAVAVMATPDQIARIQQLPFVRETKMVGGEWQLSSVGEESSEGVVTGNLESLNTAELPVLTDQLVRMKGELFRQAGFDGKGLRIAIFDAGFPHVDTHVAFKHLRDNGQILKTWNFPDKKENVYGWNGHGTMTFSCIAGIINGRQLGLATGSEFLLARTEVEPEPFKEEVWWMQAMEWADQNGADLISSSLGYGKDRHYTYEMDGTSYVAKAANMAAQKGMLVCNSAGNEGDDRRWKTIITPADAENVICVGGIEDNLNTYRHISFSSFGPSADGRLKPNVCNFGHAVVANPGKDTAATMAYGTSFSCPLTTGFVACAWQTRRNLTAMQMKAEIEKSADLYPYYDYAFGYGVPQADYFLTEPVNKVPTFRFENRDKYVAVVPTGAVKFAKPKQKVTDAGSDQPSQTKLSTVFFKSTLDDGTIESYNNVEFVRFDTTRALAFYKGGLYHKTLSVSYEGYTEDFRLSEEECAALRDSDDLRDFSYAVIDNEEYIVSDYEETLSRTPADLAVKEKPWQVDVAFMFGDMLRTSSNENALVNPWSPTFQVDFRFAKPVRKWYALGFGIDISALDYRFDKDTPNELDNMLKTNQPNGTVSFERKTLAATELGLELFQRIRITSGGIFRKGLHWDLGLYGNYTWYSYQVVYPEDQLGYVGTEVRTYDEPEFVDNSHLNYGVLTRLTYDWIGVYARYRLTDIGVPDILTLDIRPGNFLLKLPRLEVGLQLVF